MRVLMLTHPNLVPPEGSVDPEELEGAEWKSDWDVSQGFRDLGHEVRILGIVDDLRPLRVEIEEWSPHIVFNGIEFFHNEPLWDHNIPSWLELLKVPYTGCNPRGMVLSRGKSLAKRIVAPLRIPVPDHFVVPMGRTMRRPPRMGFPLIVKSLTEHASAGISQASVVDSDERLLQRIGFIHERIGTDALIEEYIDGRELYVGVLGNRRLQVLPTWELMFTNMPEGSAHIASAWAKRNVSYQQRRGILQGHAADVDAERGEEIRRMAKRIYRAFEMDGYARIDFRLGARDGRLYFLEANANADLGRDQEFATAALHAGMNYSQLLEKVLWLGMQRGR
jgi:D-alanine-D-alanine ligase